jgi:hypothetical protein
MFSNSVESSREIFALVTEVAYRHVSHMKTLTLREFFHSPSLVRSLQPGQSMLVTSQGKPELIVTKASQRPKKTAQQWQEEARALLTSKPRGRKIDTVAILRELRK